MSSVSGSEGPSTDSNFVRTFFNVLWGIVEQWTNALVNCDEAMPRIGGSNLRLVSVFSNSTLLSFASGARPRALVGDHYAK